MEFLIPLKRCSQLPHTTFLQEFLTKWSCLRKEVSLTSFNKVEQLPSNLRWELDCKRYQRERLLDSEGRSTSISTPSR